MQVAVGHWVERILISDCFGEFNFTVDLTTSVFTKEKICTIPIAAESKVDIERSFGAVCINGGAGTDEETIKDLSSRRTLDDHKAVGGGRRVDTNRGLGVAREIVCGIVAAISRERKFFGLRLWRRFRLCGGEEKKRVRLPPLKKLPQRMEHC